MYRFVERGIFWFLFFAIEKILRIEILIVSLIEDCYGGNVWRGSFRDDGIRAKGREMPATSIIHVSIHVCNWKKESPLTYPPYNVSNISYKVFNFQENASWNVLEVIGFLYKWTSFWIISKWKFKIYLFINQNIKNTRILVFSEIIAQG